MNRRAAWGTSRDPREVAVRPTATVITVFSCASFSEIIVTQLCGVTLHGHFGRIGGLDVWRA